jgi:hypothetical protein
MATRIVTKERLEVMIGHKTHSTGLGHNKITATMPCVWSIVDSCIYSVTLTAIAALVDYNASNDTTTVSKNCDKPC